MKKISLVTLVTLLCGCTFMAEEAIDQPLCPPEEVSTGMCINNPQSPCCDPQED